MHFFLFFCFLYFIFFLYPGPLLLPLLLFVFVFVLLVRPALHRFLAVHNLRKIFTFRRATKTKRRRKSIETKFEQKRRRKNRQMKEKTKHGKNVPNKFMWHVVNKPGYALHMPQQYTERQRAHSVKNVPAGCCFSLSLFLLVSLRLLLSISWAPFSVRGTEIEIKNKQTSERHLPTTWIRSVCALSFGCSTH